MDGTVKKKRPNKTFHSEASEQVSEYFFSLFGKKDLQLFYWKNVKFS